LKNESLDLSVSDVNETLSILQGKFKETTKLEKKVNHFLKEKGDDLSHYSIRFVLGDYRL
jgi:hypothetical protein